MSKLKITLIDQNVPVNEIIQRINEEGVTKVSFCCNYISSGQKLLAVANELPNITNEQVTEIGFDSLRLGTRNQNEFDNLMSKLAECEFVTKLSLKNNGFGDYTFPSGSLRLLSRLPLQITELNLKGNNLGGKHSSENTPYMLCVEINSLTNTLNLLSLANNNLGAFNMNSFMRLMNAFENKPQLIKVDLSNNNLENIGTEEVITNLLSRSRKQFILGNTDFEKRLIKNLNSEKILAFASPSLLLRTRETFFYQGRAVFRRNPGEINLNADVIRVINGFLPKSTHSR